MPSPEPTSQERGFRPALWGFDKNDVLAYMNALANESQQQELMYQDQVKQLQDQVEKLKDAQTKARICVEKLQGDLAKSISRAEAAEARADTAEQENTVLTSQLTAAEEKAESYAGRYQEARQSNSEAQLRIRDMQKEIERIKTEQAAVASATAYVPPILPEPVPEPELEPEVEQDKEPELEQQPAIQQPAPVQPAADVTEEARIEARKILLEARLKAEQAEQRISEETRLQKLRMADNARDLAAGVLLLKERLAGVDESLNAASLDLDNATAAIYSALDSTTSQISELEQEMSDFGEEPTVAEEPASPERDSTPTRTLRPKVTAQPVARRTRPLRRQDENSRRLRRAEQRPNRVSQDLLDAIDRLDKN